MLVFARYGLYTSRRIAGPLQEFRGVFHALVIGIALLALTAYALDLDVARRWIPLTFVFALPLITLERSLVRRVFTNLRRKGRFTRRVVIIGANSEGRSIAEMLQSQPELGYSVAGFVDNTAKSNGIPVVGTTDQALEAIARTGATGAIVATTSLDVEATNRIVRELLDAGVYVELSSALRDIASNRLFVRPLGEFPVVFLEPVRHHGWRAFAKRTFDVVGSAGVLLVLSPVLLLVALGIKLDSKGPVLFRQIRVGRNGEPFTICKFRTMCTDAELRLADLEAQNEADGPLFKIRDDPRVTRDREVPAGVLGRRAAAALERAARRHEPRRPATGAPDRSHAVEREGPPAAARQAGPHRNVAGARAERRIVRELQPPRPVLRRQLVAHHRPRNRVAHDPHGAQSPWGVLGARARLRGMVHEVAAAGFSDPADYEAARPSYPADAVAWIVDGVEIGPQRRVCDLAAGTGKFTRLLTSTGADIVAVEPVSGMRATFRRMLPEVPLLVCTAEAMPFANASLDAVTVAQAWHWFDHDRAAAEMARVVRPGGGVALIWNARDRTVPWVDAVWSIMDRVEKRAPWRVHENWRSSARQLPGFEAMQTAEFRHAQSMTPEGVVQRVASVSHVAVLPDAERAAVLDEVRTLVATNEATRGHDTVDLFYRVDCIAFRRP